MGTTEEIFETTLMKESKLRELEIVNKRLYFSGFGSQQFRALVSVL